MVFSDIDAELIISAVLGVTSHWAYFIHGEHHNSAPFLAQWYIVLVLAASLYQLHKHSYATLPALRGATAMTGVYVISLFTSMTIYRVFFHQLRSFPGPSFARVSKLWHAWKMRGLKNYLLMEKLNHKYGAFVRTGPSELTIFDPEALQVVEGPGSKFRKTDFYDILPLKSLGSIRDQEEHDARRRIWNRAFSTKALRGFEDRLLKYGEQLSKQLQSAAGQPVHCNECFEFLAFDVMGDVGLRKSFNMLSNWKWNASVKSLRDLLVVQGLLGSVPWLCSVLLGLPGIYEQWNRPVSYTKELIKERILSGEAAVADISSYLIEASMDSGTLEEDRGYLEGDALIMLFAGSDTSSTTFIYLFYLLARFPVYQKQIRQELKTISSISDMSSLQNLEVLRSVITEALRLYPPVPVGAGRITPPGGVTISGVNIPGGTTIFLPRYSIARLESCFERGSDFVPERWTSKPGMVKDKRAWAPFSQGRYGCVGKGLAMKMITYVTALLVSKYDVEFAPGEDGTKVWKEMKDQFTAVPGQLELVFKQRIAI